MDSSSSQDHRSDNVPRGKRGRRSNPKVKTGCSVCRLRRIKCDELRPSCSQCVKSKRACTGYPPPARGDVSSVDIRIAPKPILSDPSRPERPVSPHACVIRPTVLPPRRPNRQPLEKRQAKQPVVEANLQIAPQPSNTLKLGQSEGLYYELFRIQTASEMSGYFNSKFWAQLVLQECHNDAAIRHSVVALGALYKTLEESFYHATMSTQRKVVHLESLITHWQIAVKQYSDACNAMVLLNGQSLRSHRTRLMASVLLACFDSFIGDHKQAIVQIQAGLGLIEQIQTMYPKHQNPRPEGFIEEDLLIIFTRLAIQAKSYDMAFHFPQPYVIRLAAQHSTLTGPSTSFMDAGSSGGRSNVSIPSRFTSLVDARVASDKLNEKLLRFIEHLQIAKNDKSNVLPASWKHYGMDLKGHLDAWGAAFEHIFKSRTGPQISSVEQAAISALKMFHINTNVLFMMMFCDTESHFDGFLPQFTAIVNLGWEVICAERRRVSTDDVWSDKCSPRQHVGATGTLSQIKPSFSADLGIVPPLFVVATKCREPRLRRQAIRLLRSSARREGMWDSELAANIGHWIMTVEEGGDAAQPHQHNSEPMPTEPIPEERRVMVKSVDFDLRDRFADLRVGTRAVHEGQADSRVRVTRLTW